MKGMPVPGGKEENYLKELEGYSHKTDVRNKYVATTDREYSAVRVEMM